MLDSRPLRSLGSSSYSLYLIHGPIVIVIYEEFVAGRFRHGALAFVITIALAVPLTITFARLFAAVFETPFRRRTWSWPFRRQRPEAKRVPA
jgi:peptidoglycan/LPS O-acetylase OafA/YrhL